MSPSLPGGKAARLPRRSPLAFLMVSLFTPALLSPACPTPAAAQQRTYRIGNSLTWDSQPKGIEQLAAQRKREHVQAYHINCGKPLGRIWSHPEEICVAAVEPYGTYRRALVEHAWDAVTFQPHPGSGATLATDTARIVDFIGLARSGGRNGETVFYIYAPWPGTAHGEYHEVWERETPDADDTPTLQTRAYFEHLLRRVRGAVEAEVRLIPAGHVLYELDRRMRAGDLEGYRSAADLYRDVVHLNNVGRFAAGVTTHATLFAENPAGLRAPPNYYGGGKDFTEPLYQAVHESAWRVITELHESTGVRAAVEP